jgi:hypothetical protein
MPGHRLPVRGSDANNYVGVSSFYQDDSGRWRRRKACFAQLHALMVDDVGTKVPKRKLRLPLTSLIETSPDNFQGTYFVAQSPAARDADLCAELIDRMVASGLTADGSDPGMKGVTRVLRLPVGVNAKRKYVERLGRPFTCRLVSLHPERYYTLEEIAKAYRLDLSPPPKREFVPLAPSEITRRANAFNEMMCALAGAGLYLQSRGRWHDVVCPWVAEHTGRAENGTAIAVPSDANGWAGGFKCHHGHCDQRTIRDVYAFARNLLEVAA